MALTADKIVTYRIGSHVLTVHQKIMPISYKAPKDVADYVLKGNPMKPGKLLHGDGRPRGITIHNTADISTKTDPAETYTRATYNGNMSGVIVHFYVWHGEIWQLLDLNERGWHATDGEKRVENQAQNGMIGGNLDTIAIEAIGEDAETEETVAALTAFLCKQFGLYPQVDVYQHHFFYAAKDCPCYIIPHWDRFISMIEKFMADEKAKEEPKTEKAKKALDNTPSDWAAKEGCVKWAIENGILRGDDDGNQRLHDPITREEMCAMLYRAHKTE